jgi:hypothetical protein
MKRIAFFTLLMLSVFGFDSCKDQIAGTEFINYAAFDTNVPTIIVNKGTSTDMDINVYATQSTGAERTFDVAVVAANTTANTASYNVPVTLTIPANSNKGTITVTASDNNLGEAPVTLNLKISSSDKDIIIGTDVITLKIQKFCPFVINDFVGSWPGTDGFTTGSHRRVSQVVISNPTATTVKVTGLNFGWMTAKWGENIIDGGTITMTVNPNGTIDIPDQYCFTTDYVETAPGTDTGLPSVYWITGTGIFGNCGVKPTLTINYVIYYKSNGFKLPSDQYGASYPTFLANLAK